MGSSQRSSVRMQTGIVLPRRTLYTSTRVLLFLISLRLVVKRKVAHKSDTAYQNITHCAFLYAASECRTGSWQSRKPQSRVPPCTEPHVPSGTGEGSRLVSAGRVPRVGWRYLHRHGAGMAHERRREASSGIPWLYRSSGFRLRSFPSWACSPSRFVFALRIDV